VVRRRCPSLPVFLATSALFLVPWSAWLASSLPCRCLSERWGIAWAGFDAALAAALALTGVAALRRASWLDRAALLCIWVAQRFATPAARERNTLATTHEQGVLQ
jgi:hypothetical protein